MDQKLPEQQKPVCLCQQQSLYLEKGEVRSTSGVRTQTNPVFSIHRGPPNESAKSVSQQIAEIR